MSDGSLREPSVRTRPSCLLLNLCPRMWEDTQVTARPGPAERGRNLEAEQGHQQWVSNSWAKLP